MKGPEDAAATHTTSSVRLDSLSMSMRQSSYLALPLLDYSDPRYDGDASFELYSPGHSCSYIRSSLRNWLAEVGFAVSIAIDDVHDPAPRKASIVKNAKYLIAS